MTTDAPAFTDGERRALEPYFTNLDRPVFALRNLPEVVKAALFARYSRSAKSLRRLFLDEFLPGTSDAAGNTLKTEQSGTVGAERADRLIQTFHPVGQVGDHPNSGEQQVGVLVGAEELGQRPAHRRRQANRKTVVSR